VAKLSIYKYVRTAKGWRYCRAAFHPNGKIKPNVVAVSGVEEKHTEGRYFLSFNNQWIDIGEDALEAQRKRLLRLELTRRPASTVQSKRKYLGDFVRLIGKRFADEYRREDVLKYKSKLQDDGFEPKTIDTRMMAVVTFFNRWMTLVHTYHNYMRTTSRRVLGCGIAS